MLVIMKSANSSVDRIYEILKDGQPHRSDEITTELFGTADTQKTGLFRLGARIWDIKKDYKVEIKGYKDKDNPKLYWYQIINFEPARPEVKEPQAQRSATQGQLPMALPRIFV